MDDPEFEYQSMQSLEGYLKTLDNLNDEIVALSVRSCEKQLRDVILSVSFTMEICKSSLIVEEAKSFEDYMIKIADLTRPFDIVISRFTESMKLLNDSLYFAITGRYVPARIILRSSLECMIRGVFYFGLKTVNVKEASSSAKSEHYREFLRLVQETLKENPELTPAGLEDLMTAELKRRESWHPSFSAMFKQLVKWDMFPRASDMTIEETTNLVVKQIYGPMSETVHTSLPTTYTYYEKINPQLRIRVIWGQQFLKDLLCHFLEGLTALIDIIAAIVLVSAVEHFERNRALQHMKEVLGRFPDMSGILETTTEVIDGILSDGDRRNSDN